MRDQAASDIDGAAEARVEHTLRVQRIAGALQWCGGIGIVIIAVLRSLVAFAPAVVFDVDPAVFPGAFAGMGEPGSLWLDTLLFALCAAALFGVWLRGFRRDFRTGIQGGISWWIITLALLPVLSVLIHGWRDAGDMRIGMTWAGGALAAATLLHLCRDQRLRIVIIALLIATAGPLLARGAANMLYEIPETVAQYEAEREIVLADKGWEVDSSQARIFERRMQKLEPTAWFTSTNIFGAYMGVFALAWLGLAFGARRGRLTGGWIGLCTLVGVLSAAGLIASGSMGAALAVLGGAFGLALHALATMNHAPLLTPRRGALLLIIMFALAFIFIWLRGWLLPESLEKSLLFRYHYDLGAARILFDHFVLGVGPDEFQAMYMRFRPPRNPEEVASAHSLVWDWLARIGVLGAAWIALVVVMLWRAGKQLASSPQSADELGTALPDFGIDWSAVRPRIAYAAFTVTALALVPALLQEMHVLDLRDLIMRLLGMFAYLTLALIAGLIIGVGGARAVRGLVGGVIGAAAALALHGQIEMTFTEPGPAVFVMCILGVAAGARLRPRAIDDAESNGAAPMNASRHRISIIWPVIILAISAILLVQSAIPATRQERMHITAARLLWPIAKAREAQRVLAATTSGDMRVVAAERLRNALRELGMSEDRINTFGIGEDYDGTTRPSSSGWNEIDVFLIERERVLRPEAAERLLEAYDYRPITELGRQAAAMQLEHAARLEPFERKPAMLLRASKIGERSLHRHEDIAAGVIAMNCLIRIANLTGDPAPLAHAIKIARNLAERDPNGLKGWKQLGDLLWLAGRREEAIEAYERALRADENFALDPFKQLKDEERELIQSRVDLTRAE